MAVSRGKFTPRGRPKGDGPVDSTGIKPRYRSRSEEKLASKLTELGVSFEYEKGRIKYTRPATPTWYLPDFTLPNGVIIEVKGFWENEDRTALIRLKEALPSVDIRMAFDRPNTPIRKGSPTTYAAYCDKHGIPWAKNPDIPEEWLQ